jgi:citrate synthase
MGVKREKIIREFTERYSQVCVDNNAIDPGLFDEYGVKRGLRDKNGKGVLAGLTNISFIKSSEEIDGKSVPCEGQLYYRGYNIYDLVRGFQADGRYGFEECAYLLLFGKLPDASQLVEFKKTLGCSMTLPTNFVRDVIMKAPSHDIMNSLTKSVLTLASYDDSIMDMSLDNVLRQCLMLISVFPMLSVYGYHAYNHYECDDSLYIHRPDPTLSTAENILRMLRPDMSYTPLEASVLDAALVLHMEHGGGNNSTFTTRVVTSAGSDTYSVIAAALSSLKGPKHGGANIKVVQMMEDLRRNVEDVTDEDEVKDYLYRLLNKQAFDRSGLIYGMGHAVYSISDPRAVVFKGFVERLATEKKRHKDFELYSMIERLAPEVISEKCRIYKGVSANVDFYSGFVYSMLDIPLELYTPIFAIARIVGWSAHRLEELINVDKIIRPAYKSIGDFKPYETLKDRSTPKIDGQDNKIIGIEMTNL